MARMKVPSRPPTIRAWAGLVLAPAAWALHHQAGSDLNYADCRQGDGATVAVIGMVALAFALAGGAVSYSAWRRSMGDGDSSVVRFLALLGMMAGGLFGLTILVQIGAGLVLPSCFR